MTSSDTIAEIRRFPVKSMQGEFLDRVDLTPLGISGDRAYAVRDVATRKILSGKTAQVGPLLLACRARTLHDSVVVTVDDSDFAVDDPSLNRTMCEFLGREVVIDHVADPDDMYESYWPEMNDMALSDVTVDLPIAMSTTKGTFADLAALHLLTTSSVEHLRSLNPELDLSMHRFRPSITVASADASGLVEKNWVGRTASLGSATLTFGSESPRCVMTTTAQAGHLRQPAVLQTIARNNRVDFGGFGNFACLGIYAEVAQSGPIAVGDELRLAPIG